MSIKTGFPTTINHISIDWFDEVAIDGITITDPEDNVLAYIASAEIDYNINTLIGDNEVRLDKLILDSAHVYVTKIGKDSLRTLNINLMIRNLKKLVARPKKQPKPFKINEIEIRNSNFSYVNQDKDSLLDRFDYQHFELNNLTSNITNFVQISDTVSFSMRQLSANSAKDKLRIKSLQTDFTLSKKRMSFDKLDLQFNKSRIKEKVNFKFSNLKALSDFIKRVNIEADFKETIIYTDDLAIFAPSLIEHNERLAVSGEFSGRISRFTFKRFNIRTRDNNRLEGRVSISGLPQIEETFIDLNLSAGSIDPTKLTSIKNLKLKEYLSPFGRTQLRGKFIGFPNDFVAAGTFNTQLGKIISDINLKVGNNLSSSLYSGKLEMDNFDIGKFSNKAIFDMVTLKGEIKGKGLTFGSADFELKGNIDQIDIYGYNYTNINTDAHFAQELFEGSLTVDDPNLKAAIDGEINLRDGEDHYVAQVSLDEARLKPLNITQNNVLLIGDADIDASGLKIDSIAGGARLTNIFIEYNGKPLVIDSLLISTSRDAQNLRSLKVQSDLFDLNMGGTYQYTSATKSVLNLLKEYRLNLTNNQQEIDEYYTNKQFSQDQSFTINYDILLKDVTPLVKLFNEDISISKNTKLEGMYSSGYTSILSLNTIIDTLQYQNHKLYGLGIDVSTSKISDSTNVLAMGFISSEKQLISDRMNTENLLIETIWDNDHIDFEFGLEQQQYNNSSEVTGSIDFISDTTKIRFDQSSIDLFERKWVFDKKNKIEISQSEVIITDFKVFNEIQNISVSGIVSRDPVKRVLINFENINLDMANPIVTKELAGDLSGFVQVSNLYQEAKVDSDISLTDFHLDDFLIGDIQGKTSWKEENQALKIKAYLDRENLRAININGYYYPNDPITPLDLRANFDQAPLSILEPFFNKFFSNVGGEASGVFKITGTPKTPIVTGTGSASNGAIKINYLNTSYTFEGGFGFTGQQINFNDIKLQDALNQNALLTGNIQHKGFKNMIMNLKGDLANFQILNTSSTDNNLFYGEGYASGTVSFEGPIRNMTINAKARSTKGTKIFIPIGEVTSIEQEEYITFTNFTQDSVATTKIDVEESIDLRGLTMNFDLDITPDAYCELIFDIKSGDIIRGRGNGQINLQIDTQGEFNMFGDYVLDQGGYNFTLYNIINKEFNLLPESKISWYGDPYQGILDMNATYSQITSLSPLIDTTFQNIPAIRRGYPVDVELALDGPLLSPEIGFDINVHDYPATVTGSDGSTVYLEDAINLMENRIATDEHELNRQVFSLIVLRKFSPPESFNTAGSIGNSVSEFISNQLSYWVSQVDENLEVDVDLGNLDAEAFNTFQLRLSYTFLDGRLRVTREGGISNQDQSQNDVSGIVGDWTVEYMLTPDGKLRAKMYNRTNYNNLNSSSLNSTTTVTTGFSLLHTQNFETIREMIVSERRRQREKKQNQGDQNETTQATRRNEE